jgi:hypothetical protein
MKSVGGYDIGPGRFYTFLLRIYDILYGEKHGNLHSNQGISVELLYSLYGDSLLAALFSMSHIQPYLKPCAQFLYRPLGSNESAVGLVLPTKSATTRLFLLRGMKPLRDRDLFPNPSMDLPCPRHCFVGAGQPPTCATSHSLLY